VHLVYMEKVSSSTNPVSGKVARKPTAISTRVSSDTVDKRSIDNRAGKLIIDYLSITIDNSGSRR
jgi:hypothetical protein